MVKKRDKLLDVRGMELKRDGKSILRDVSLSVWSGEIHCLLGLNGSGKSSLAYVLMGCSGYSPTSGSIIFDGKDVTNLHITERARLGMTLAWQEPARFEGLRVSDYLRVGIRDSAGADAESRIMDALKAVSLPPEQYLSRSVNETLSGGERKRIELAAVYTMRPKLAILDEPDSGIDVLSLSEISELIRKMADGGSSVLLITHRDEMVPVADVASLMCDGTIIRTGSPKSVREHYAKRCRPCEVVTITERNGGAALRQQADAEKSEPRYRRQRA